MRFPHIKREVKDIDIIGYTDDISKLCDILLPKEVKRSKYSVIFKGVTKKTDTFDTDNVELILADDSESLRMYLNYDKENLYASKETLFSLKKSHIHYPINFTKHISDFKILNDYFMGIDQLAEITILQEKETEKRLGKLRTPSLNKSVKDFFGQSEGYVQSYFIHDDIHQVMAHYDAPLYERMQNETDSAKCDKMSWFKFSYEDKCKCVLEEAYVIALERKILPMMFGGGKGYTSQEAFDWALMRICTTLCSGWFREFATVNYFTIKDKMNINYVEKFLESYEKGYIRRQNVASN